MRTVAALLLVATATASAAAPKPLVGTVGPPWTDGWNGNEGACVSMPGSSAAPCSYAIGVVNSGSQSLIYFATRSNSQTEKVARWTVLDTIPMPLAPPGYRLVLFDCSRNGQPNPTIIAVVSEYAPDKAVAIRSAYDVDPKVNQFRSTSTRGIECTETSHGS
jgi:hypothetical protein